MSFRRFTDYCASWTIEKKTDIEHTQCKAGTMVYTLHIAKVLYRIYSICPRKIIKRYPTFKRNTNKSRSRKIDFVFNTRTITYAKCVTHVHIIQLNRICLKV